MAKLQEKGLEHSDILDDLFEGTIATKETAWALSQSMLPNDSVGLCQEISSSSNDNND